jgi:opacity protein-like surface antigen
MQLRALALATACLLSSGAAHAGCFVGGSVGANLTAPSVNNGIANIGVSTQTVLASPELGCDLGIGHGFAVGGLIRADFAPYTAGSLASLNEVESKGSYSGLGKLSYKINSGASVYALGGLTSTQFSLNGFGTSATGTTFGGGLELAIANTSFSAFAEADVTTYGYKTVSGISAKPNNDVFRVGLRWRPDFGGSDYATLK